MSSSNALVKCIHQSHSKHPLIIALHHSIKSWNYLQSNNKIAKSSENCKAGCNESCKPGKRGSITYRSQYFSLPLAAVSDLTQ
ncbi:hypothetical protein FMK65_25215 [Klebsiella variicola]|nr:hypothetical protein [Klebsiella variicola]PXK03787.1 hypothetical protein DMR34_26925 [Klebsiella variicola]